MNKPSSKVIQISTIPSLGEWEFVALCEDSSIWSYSTSMKDANERWQCILEAPAQPKFDLPEVGSRWQGRYTRLEVRVDCVKVYYETDLIRAEATLKQFLDSYEPIPTKSDNKE